MVNILLTGASRGIGAAARRALTAAGHHGIGQSTAGGNGCIAADFAGPRAADALWQEALAAGGGRIDVLVNNAGVFEAAGIGDADGFAATWARSHAINLQAAADLCRHAVLHFQASGGGRIINVASRAGHRGDSPDHWHYAAAKAGMIALTKSLALSLGQYGITVNGLNPGMTDTPLARDANPHLWNEKIALDVLGTANLPEQAAQTLLYLAGVGGSYTTGQILGTRLRHGQ